MSIPYNEYLIRAADPEAYSPDDFRCVIRVKVDGDDTILNILHTEDPTLPGDSLIRGWNWAGIPIKEGDVADFATLRSFGNELPRNLYDGAGEIIGQTRGGDATGPLLAHHFSGWRQRELGTPPEIGEEAALYPDDNLPFTLITDYYWYDQAEFSGWGFLTEWQDGEENTRLITNRAMAVYSDSDCENYLWTGGAFQLGPSRLGQLDENGDPLQVYFSDTPAGQRNAEKETRHLALLFGATQEGFFSLEPSGGRVTKLFWEQTQVPPPSGETWVDTGATVVAPVGQLFQISSAAVAASLSPGQAIRFGDTLETTFVQIWPGWDDLLEIDPPVAAQIGDVLWSWE